MSFAENLKQLRKVKQLSQEELAELLDVSRQAVSKVFVRKRVCLE